MTNETVNVRSGGYNQAGLLMGYLWAFSAFVWLFLKLGMPQAAVFTS